MSDSLLKLTQNSSLFDFLQPLIHIKPAGCKTCCDIFKTQMGSALPHESCDLRVFMKNMKSLYLSADRTGAPQEASDTLRYSYDLCPHLKQQ